MFLALFILKEASIGGISTGHQLVKNRIIHFFLSLFVSVRIFI